MTDHMKHVLRENPDHIVFHIGTNVMSLQTKQWKIHHQSRPGEMFRFQIV